MAVVTEKRIIAGLWFLTAAGFVIAPLFILTADYADKRGFSLIWFSPLIISGLVGSFLGAGILDAQRTKNGWSAALQGFFTALISFLLYAVVRSGWEAYTNPGDLGFGKVFLGMLIMILWAAALIGWVIMVIGALAGLTLYLVFASRERQSGSM